MKNYLSVITLFTLFSLLGCGKSAVTVANNPGETAVLLFSSITSGNAQVIKDNIYISDEVQRDVFNEWVDMMVASQQYKESTKGYNPSYSVVEEKIDGETAEVLLAGKNPAGQNVQIKVKLLVVDGRWKVDGDHGVWH